MSFIILSQYVLRTQKGIINLHMFEVKKKEYWGQCRVISEIVYVVCKFLHLKGNYKINILQYMRGNDIRKRGHAWVTCNDKDLFLTPAHRPQSMSKIGENDKYCYWVSVKQGRLKRCADSRPKE